MGRFRVFFVSISLSVVILLVCCTLPVSAQSAAPQPVNPMIGPMVRLSMHHDVSPALRDLPPLSDTGEREAEPVYRIPLPAGLKAPEEPDMALQNIAPATAVPATLGLNFEGIGST